MPELAVAAAPRPVPSHLDDWILRISVAALFFYAGLEKFDIFFGTPWVKIFGLIGFGDWFRYATGGIEAIGGMLLLVPRLTLVAVPALICTMVGAIWVHVSIVGTGFQTVVVVQLIGTLFAIGWRHRAGARSLA